MNKLLSTLIIGTSVFAFSSPSIAMEEDPSESSKAICLMALPDEAHIGIVRHFTPKELATMALVSRHWTGICEENSIWRNIATKNRILLSKEDLTSDHVKLKVKEYVTSPTLTTLKNGTESTLFVKPIITLFHGPSINEIKKWRTNPILSSQNVNSIETGSSFPEYELGSGETLKICMPIIQQYVLVPQAQAYIADFRQVSIGTLEEKDSPYDFINNLRIITDPQKYNKACNKYTIKASPNHRHPYTLELNN